MLILRLSLAVALFTAVPAFAHLSYFGRDYGTFSAAVFQTKTITGQTVETNYGWADGTDADFTSTHYQTYFKFTLQASATITLSVTSLDPANFLPGFSIYGGLGQTSPPDYDESGITLDYLESLGLPVKEGGFDALHTWKMGNDNDTAFADLTTFTYVAHAADGTPANFGPASGIVGDGLANGSLSGTFTLPAGSYTVAIGGANYFNQVDSNLHGFTTTLTVVPEPSICCLMLVSFPLLGLIRHRTRTRV